MCKHLRPQDPPTRGNGDWCCCSDKDGIPPANGLDWDLPQKECRLRFYGKTPTDITYYSHESVLFELPGADFPIPLPYILTYKEIQLSGVLK